MKRYKQMMCAALAAVMLAAGGAQASLFTNPGDIGSPNVITFDDYFGFITSGPENVGASIGQNVLMTATTPSTLGAFIAELGANGTWSAFVGSGSPFAGIGALGDPAATGVMTFSFASGPTSAVGGFLNYFAPAANAGLVVITALGAGNTLLESYVLNISTAMSSYNDGAFFGIQRASADIFGFAIFGTGFVVDNLTFATPVPEPSVYAMLALGLGLLGFAARRRRNGSV